MLTAKILFVYLLSSVNGTGLDVDTTMIDPEQAYCLAENIYYEARSESIQGQIAVASVTLNRANDARFPDTICEVVKFTAKSKIDNKMVCAFSWYCENDRKGREIPVRNKDGSVNQKVVDQFQIASMVAINALSGNVKDNTHGATHFYNPSLSNPAWKNELKKTVAIGNHNFYRFSSIKVN